MDTVRGRNPASMLFHDPLANCKTQSGGITGSTEAWLEDARNLVRPHTASGVGKLSADIFGLLVAILAIFCIPLTERHSNLSARLRMANGVRDEIQNHLLKRA